MIHFTCKTCDEKMEAPDSAAGETLKCPKCGLLEKVPVSDEYELKPADDDTPVTDIAPQQNQFVEFRCECGEDLSADIKQIGQPIQCPFCEAETIVPEVKAQPARPQTPLIFQMEAWREPLGPDYEINVHEKEIHCIPRRKGQTILLPKKLSKSNLSVHHTTEKLIIREPEGEKFSFKITAGSRDDDVLEQFPILNLYHLDAWLINFSESQADRYVFNKFIKSRLTALAIWAGIQLAAAVVFLIVLAFTDGLSRFTIVTGAAALAAAGFTLLALLLLKKSWGALVIPPANILCIIASIAYVAKDLMKADESTISLLNQIIIGVYTLLLILLLVNLRGYLNIAKVNNYYGF